MEASSEDATSARTALPIGHVYRFEEIAEAHTEMEAGTSAGKLVVTV